MTQTADCINRLQPVVSELEAEGMERAAILAGLAATLIRLANQDPDVAAIYLSSSAAILLASAELARSRQLSGRIAKTQGTDD
jgi:hypothetical protein